MRTPFGAAGVLALVLVATGCAPIALPRAVRRLVVSSTIPGSYVDAWDRISASLKSCGSEVVTESRDAGVITVWLPATGAKVHPVFVSVYLRPTPNGVAAIVSRRTKFREYVGPIGEECIDRALRVVG